MPRLLVCEDDVKFRRLLARALRSGGAHEVVAVATGEEACAAVRSAQRAGGVGFDLLLLDLELPGIDGLEVIRRVRVDSPLLEVLVLTSFGDERRVFEAVRVGAAGYLVKGVALSQLERAIGEVLAGGTIIDARLARRFWNLLASERGRAGADFGLTAEEREVLAAVARGLSNPEAARALGASRRAIKGHLEAIYRKLGVTSRVEAAVLAMQHGLIEL
jgi:two-component system nitrate/nitrite response regulator NarL